VVPSAVLLNQSRPAREGGTKRLHIEISFEVDGVESVRGDYLRIILMQLENHGFPGARTIIEEELRNRLPGRRQPIIVNGSFRVEGGVNELDTALKAIGRAITFVKIFEPRAASSGKPGELAACRNAINFLEKFYSALDPTPEMEYLSLAAALEPEVQKAVREWPLEELITRRQIF